jgi:hypothetical protein
MRPVVYSRRLFEETGVGWHEGGCGVRYRRDKFYRKDGVSFYTLSFCVETGYSQDTVLVASAWVYPYSRMLGLVEGLLEKARNSL